ncbi:MAG: hypothetical protein DME98_07205 [Verrucomicrobia bacterium]|nr:MAG: hypothetical protein DME98_07205 [Verrucomicrobiota bacterium]PYJ34554.1 MAG: hypothetical protein DME88_04835 [Verrucomicrobiota bacterium]
MSRLPEVTPLQERSTICRPRTLEPVAMSVIWPGVGVAVAVAVGVGLGATVAVAVAVGVAVAVAVAVGVAVAVAVAVAVGVGLAAGNWNLPTRVNQLALLVTG